MAIFVELARRTITHSQTAALAKRSLTIQPQEGEEMEMPRWGIILLFTTMVLGFAFVTLVSYMLKEVVTTLCMVESPVAAITISQSEDGDHQSKEGLLETAPTITLVHQKPITSSIRATIRHLVTHAGCWARFRGIQIQMIHTFCVSTIAQMAFGMVFVMPGRVIAVAALAGALCANLHAAWTHKVVSMPSQKSLWQRIPARSHWKTLALPAAVESAMPHVSFYLTCGFAMLMRLDKLGQEDLSSYDCAQLASVLARAFAVFLFAIACTLFLCLPAIVTLVRIEASILPEDEDVIVPFDRTFGGKVMPKLLGGTGSVSFLDAWRSFNWEARRRIIKLYVKIFFAMAGLTLFIAHVLAFEVFVIMGPQLGKTLSQMKHQGYKF